MSKLTNTYRFSFESDCDEDDNGWGYPKQKSVSMEVQHSEDTEWGPILLDFADFLSSIYGYDVKNKIRIVRGTSPFSSRVDEYCILDDGEQDEFNFNKDDKE